MNGQTYDRRNNSATHPSPCVLSPASAASQLDAADFAEYLRAEGERRRLTQDGDFASPDSPTASADNRNWPGGMYRRAMMRAYAESLGVDREAALTQLNEPVPVPVPQPAPPTPAPRRSMQPQPPPAARRVVATSRRMSRAHAARALAVAVSLAAVGVVALVVSSPAAPEPPTVSAPAVAEAAPRTALAHPVPSQTPAASPRPTPPVVPSPARRAAPALASPPPRIAAASEGTLVVNSNPAGARVTVNGVGWGNTPVTIRHLEFGSKRIRVTHQGYLSDERVVTLTPGNANGQVRLTLRQRP